MTFARIATSTLAVILLCAPAARAELHHAEIKTLGMD